MHEIVRWLHFVGFSSWLAGLVALGLILRGGAGAAARPAAMLADIGATLTIISGVYRAVSFGLFSQPYIHIKLLFVAALIGVHGALRVKLKRKNSQAAGTMVIVTGILATIILFIIVFKPLAR
jgi:uncharacterized membrane protein